MDAGLNMQNDQMERGGGREAEGKRSEQALRVIVLENKK